MLRQALFIVVLGVLSVLSSCAFHSTAKDWNGLAGSNGKPTYYKTTTKLGIKLAVAIPFIGNIGIDGMVDDLTAEIAEQKGDHIRIVQGSTENYWYGFPPLTWILTPVISKVAAEYTPDQTTYLEDQAIIREEEKNNSCLNPTEW